MAGAAFFDLDRTLLKKASTPYIRKALSEVGLTSAKAIPGEGLMLRWYNSLGESIPHMALARLAAYASQGWPVELAQRAGEMVAGTLAEQLAPFARPLLDEHRKEGRKLVLATTTPYHLVAPFARLIGFDDVIATKYEVRDDRFTGRLDGAFIWSGWKLSAVRNWAKDNGCELSESFAYSDSVYDAPLLAAVGHPFAVNPDPSLRALATARRWPVLHLDVPPGVPKLGGMEPFNVVARLARPSTFPFAKFQIQGTERIPKKGPVIIACNHRSYFDVAAVGMLASKIGRPIRFLAKKEVTDAPVIGYLARAMGAIRVDRGSRSDQPLAEAIRALKAGDAVGIFPQGTIPRGSAFYETNLIGRTGVARLAAATGAPVVPVAIWGTEKVWPRSARIPHVSNVLNAPKVSVMVGKPIRAAVLQLDANSATEAIMDAIAKLLPEEARTAKVPTASEIASASPPSSGTRTAKS
ncbi:MAG TPA: HAD-IB family hydrolase [Acidimicrobiales bacterium]|nr:HAD-IB family hydrolase [Acidimicrobiales bacterium]